MSPLLAQHAREVGPGRTAPWRPLRSPLCAPQDKLEDCTRRSELAGFAPYAPLQLGTHDLEVRGKGRQQHCKLPAATLLLSGCGGATSTRRRVCWHKQRLKRTAGCQPPGLVLVILLRAGGSLGKGRLNHPIPPLSTSLLYSD